MPQASTNVLEKKDTKTEKPRMWNIIYYNDNITPIDYVIQTLMDVFKKKYLEAMEITHTIHKSGNNGYVVATYPKGIAQTKVQEVQKMNYENRQELQVEAQPEE